MPSFAGVYLAVFLSSAVIPSIEYFPFTCHGGRCLLSLRGQTSPLAAGGAFCCLVRSLLRRGEAVEQAAFAAVRAVALRGFEETLALKVANRTPHGRL